MTKILTLWKHCQIQHNGIKDALELCVLCLLSSLHETSKRRCEDSILFYWYLHEPKSRISPIINTKGLVLKSRQDANDKGEASSWGTGQMRRGTGSGGQGSLTRETKIIIFNQIKLFFWYFTNKGLVHFCRLDLLQRSKFLDNKLWLCF